MEHEDGNEAECNQQLHHQDAVHLANEALADAFVRELKAGTCQRVFDIISHASVHIGVQSRSNKRSALNKRFLLHYVSNKFFWNLRLGILAGQGIRPGVGNRRPEVGSHRLQGGILRLVVGSPDSSGLDKSRELVL
jgi:hypothetical protein